jgi:hypothetical protein
MGKNSVHFNQQIQEEQENLFPYLLRSKEQGYLPLFIKIKRTRLSAVAAPKNRYGQ